MSKLRKRLSKWFLNLADKVDQETFKNETMIIPLSGQPMNVTIYDRNNVEKIHIQQAMTNYELAGLSNSISIEDMIHRKMVESLSWELIKTHKDEIKKTGGNNPYGEQTIFSLDLYVCKPQFKKEGDI